MQTSGLDRNFIPLKVVTFSNKDVAPARNWKKAMDLYGHDSHIVSGPWVNFMSKIKGTRDYLLSIPHKYVAFLDCYDAFAQKGPEGLVEAFLSFGSDIVVSSEVYSSIGKPVSRFKDLGPSKYVNSGFYIGLREPVLAMLSWMLEHEKIDDQVALCSYIEENPHGYNISLDHKSKLCLTCVSPPITSSMLKQDSFFVHTPASSYDLHFRYNSYGREILKRDFEPLSAPTRLRAYFLALMLFLLFVFIAGKKPLIAAVFLLLLFFYMVLG